jgi:hypothetical protein
LAAAVSRAVISASIEELVHESVRQDIHILHLSWAQILEEEEEEEGVEAPLSAVDDAKEDAAPLEEVAKKVTRQKESTQTEGNWLELQAHHEQEGFKKAEPPAAETPVEPLVSDTEPIELENKRKRYTENENSETSRK